jgi:hypothetical protein
MSTDIINEDTCLILLESRIPLAIRAIMDKIRTLPLKTRERLCLVSPPINTRRLAESFLEQEAIHDLETWIDSIISS